MHVHVLLHNNTSAIAKPSIATNQGMGTLRTRLYTDQVYRLPLFNL